MSTLFRLAMLGASTLALSACAGGAAPQQRAPTAPAASSAPADPEASAPTSVAEPSADDATPEPKRDPVMAAVAKLAGAWCKDGLGMPDKAAAPPCDRIRAEIDQRQQSGALESALIALIVDAGSQSDVRHAYLRRGDHAASVRLVQGWSSGVGAFSHEISVGTIHVEDVVGDETPEWWTQVELESHDTDAGECRTRGSVERSLVLCSWQDTRFACLRLPFAKSSYDEIWADVSNTACKKPRLTNEGYAAEIAVSRDGVRIEPRKKGPDGRAFTRAKPAPARGTVSITELFGRFPAEVLALEPPGNASPQP